jgi:tetratricopeptide (TPR) repeat protein
MAHIERGKKQQSLSYRLKRALRDKDMWKRFALEGALVLFVLAVLFFDTFVTWINKPAVKTNDTIERINRQRVVKITDSEKQEIFTKVRALIETGKIDLAVEQMQEYLIRDPSTAEAHYLIGTAYFRKGQVLSAFEHLQEAVRLKPDYLEAHKTLGELYLLAGNVKAAQNAASLLIRQPDYLQDGYLLESEIAKAEGNLDEAFDKVQKALSGAKEPPNVRVSAHLATLYVRKGNRAKAEELMNTFDRTTLNADGLVTLGKFYLSIADEANAVAAFKEALKRYPQDPDANYSYGQFLFLKGQFRDSATYYKKAMTAMPDVTIIAYRAGQSLLAARALDEAGVLIDQLLNRNPNDLLTLRLNVQYQLQRGERKKALNTLNQIASLTPNAPRIYLVLAELYLAEGVVTLAEKNALKAIERGEKAASPWMILGDIYFRRGQFTKALSYYEKVLAVQPDNLSLMLRMGDAHLSLGQGSKAEGLYKKAFSRYPNAKYIQNKLAWARVAVGDPAGALVISQQYFSNTPRDINALAGYVNVLVASNRLDDAMSLVRQNLKLQRDSPWLMNLLLGDLYVLKKDVRSAADSYREVLQLRPHDVNLTFNIAMRYEQMNLGKEAETLYVAVQKQFPKNMLYVNHLAWFYIDRVNEPQKAAKLVSILESEGEGGSAKDTIGWYYYRTGNIKSAEYYLREAALLDPDNVLVRAHLALTLFEMKKDQEASTEAKRVMDALPESPLKEKLKAFTSPPKKTK